MKVGEAGAKELNLMLQNILNPKGLDMLGTGYRKGDRVMQIKNNYKLDIFNGDIGFVEGCDPEDKALTINFYGKRVRYPLETLKTLVLAYAQTIHKSQGSEYPVVIIVMLGQHFIMLERNLLYTATTRAKKLCVYLASKHAIETAAKTSRVGQRNSMLNIRIRQAQAQLESKNGR